MLLLLTAIAAVLLNCYPVVFCGRSFVSPNNGAPDNGGNSLLYDTTPTLPGCADERIADFHGADTGAIMWHDVPNAFVEARALRLGALPLWNRYKNAGDPLLAQGISMFGDPFHLIVLLGRGSAWAWDLKFLLAKTFFCFGCGLLVLTLTQRLSLAVLFTVTSAYCGLFNFVPNHPGFFVFCYCPWILFSLVQAADASPRRRFGSGLLWLAVNTGCFNAGHVEAAVVCLAGLNSTGLAYALLAAPDRGERGRVLWRMLALGALLAGLNAPVWLPFLTYLPHSFNLHTDVAIEQFPLPLLAGLFDDCFYHAVQTGPLAQAPGGTLFLLLGTLFALASYRELRHETFFWVNVAALVASCGFIFGYIPPALIAKLPLIGQIGHVRADFSYVAIMLSIIGSAYGWVALMRLEPGVALRRWLTAVAGLALTESLFFWSTRTFFKTPEFYAYVAVVTFATIAAPVVYLFFQKLQGMNRIAALGALGVLLFLPHARFGLYTFGPDQWVLRPGPRARLDFPSAAVDYIKQHSPEPFRATGLAWDLYGGYGAVYGLEDIKGVSALMNRSYVELCAFYPGMDRDAYLIQISDATAAHHLLNMLNVRYLLLNPEDAPPPNLPYPLAATSDLTVFANEQVWPRAFFTNTLRTYDGLSQFISLLQQDGNQPFAAISEAALARHPELRGLTLVAPAPAIQPAHSYSLGVNETAFEIEATAKGVVLLSEPWIDHAFTVEVNGGRREVLRLNYALKGVFLDRPGHYSIVFRYRPAFWLVSSALFLLAASILAAQAVAALFRIAAARRADYQPNR